MKTRLIAAALLAFAFANVMLGQDANQNYSISQDKKTITVWGDCTINVEDFAPTTNIYGNKEKGGWGSKTDFFKTKTQSLNNDCTGVEFNKSELNDKGIAQIRINYANLGDSLKLEFYKATIIEKTKSDSAKVKDWCPTDGNNGTQKETFSIVVKKRTEDEAILAGREEDSASNLSNTNFLIIKESDPSDNLGDGESDKPKENETKPDDRKDVALDIYKALFFVLLIVAIALGLLVAIMGKKLAKLKEELENAHKEIGKGQLMTGKSDRTFEEMKAQFSQQSDKLNQALEKLNNEVIELKGKIAALAVLPQPSVQKSANSNANVSSAPAAVAIDTSEVIYHPDNNTFTMGNTTMRIFRVYSRGNDYYYTIVDDDAIRTEIVAVLNVYEKCISVQPTSGGSRVVPVTEGRLFKDGDVYMVDSNNKLVVRLD